MLKYIAVATTIGLISFAGAAGAEEFGDPVVKGQVVTTADMLNPKPLPPEDIYRRTSGISRRSPAVEHEDLATFAWLEFIALVAPYGDRRGDPGGSFAESGFDPEAVLVWETYQHRSELLPYSAGGAVLPQPWDSTPTYDFSADGAAYNPGLSNFNNLDEVTQIGQNTIFLHRRRRDPEQILFEAKVNETSHDFVEDNYMTLAPPITQPDNVMEVKAAWVPIEAISRNQRYRYHTTEAIYYIGTDDEPIAVTGQFALLGLHIIHKTTNYPAFIFATFEQRDIRERYGVDRENGFFYTPTYDEIDYEITPTTDFQSGATVDNPSIDFNVNRPEARPNRNRVRLPLGDVEDIRGAEIVDGDVRIPVVQPPTTNNDVGAVNQQAKAAMAGIPGFDETFVWQYYELKGVQGIPTDDETSKDYYLANIVIESSQPGIQLFRGGISTSTDNNIVTFTNTRNQANVQDAAQNDETFSVGGCMGCHGIAQTAVGFDFSFLFGGLGGVGFSPDTAVEPSDEDAKARLDRYMDLLIAQP